MLDAGYEQAIETAESKGIVKFRMQSRTDRFDAEEVRVSFTADSWSRWRGSVVLDTELPRCGNWPSSKMARC